MSPEALKALVTEAIQAINDNDVEKAVSHTAPDCTLNGEPFGREGDRLRTAGMASAFPDGKWEIEDLVAEGDKIVLRWTFRGANLGEMRTLGLPATGKPVVFSGMSLYRVADGMFTEIWEGYDRLTLLQQLGVIPS
jgi:predicted ester cyclase